MGDVAVTPVPDAQQLAEIAVSTAHYCTTAVAGIDEPTYWLCWKLLNKRLCQTENVDKVVGGLSRSLNSLIPL